MCIISNVRLNRKFFNRDTVVVAKELVGKRLVRRINDKIIVARITETEAYCGQKDKASHASRGLTERTKVMFDSPGHAYIYLIYGMYYCFNVVTEKEGYPAAVLIRAVEILNSKSKFLNNSETLNQKIPNLKLNGPGILCRELKIDKKFNGIDLCISKELWIEDGGEEIPIRKIKKGKRIGVDYAGKWKNKLWRFYIDNSTDAYHDFD